MSGRLLPGAEHFAVEELPAYEPAGSGEHLYLFVEKRGLNTADVARLIARACGVSPRAVGFAGRKDKHAVTRQWFSVHFGDEAGLAALATGLPAEASLEVLRVDRHRNKLKVGHLRGNRFTLGLVDLPGDCGARLAVLAARGVANRFGPQRFGLGGMNLEIARRWAAGDHRGAACLAICGEVPAGDALPEHGRGRQGGRLLHWLRQHPGRWQRALERVERDYRGLICSAAQAAVANAVMDARLDDPAWERPEEGDVLVKPNGAAFVVTAAELDDCRGRVERLELSLSAPLPGHGVLSPGPQMLERERAWSAATGVDWAWFDQGAVFAARGDRRALRIAFLEPPVLTGDDGVSRLSFALPSGAYATTVLADLGVSVPEDRRGQAF